MGFEPTTTWSQIMQSAKLKYTPIISHIFLLVADSNCISLLPKRSTIKLTTCYDGTEIEPVSAVCAPAGTRTQDSHIKFSIQESNLNFPFMLNEFLLNSNSKSVVLYQLSYERIISGEGGIRTHGPAGGTQDFKSRPLWPLRHLSKISERKVKWL